MNIEHNNPFSLFDWAIEQRAKLKTRPPSTNLYPSEASVVYRGKHGDISVGGACLRKAWYRIKGYEQLPTNAKSEYIFQMGHNFEDNVNDIVSFIQKKVDEGELPDEAVEWLSTHPEGDTPFKWIDLFLGDGVVLEPEHRFFVDIDGLPIKGSLDFVVGAPETPLGKTFWELKTGHGYYTAREIFGNTTTPGIPKMSHLLQAFLYAVVFDVDGEYEPKLVTTDDEGNSVISDETSPHRFDGGWILYLLRDDIKRGPHHIALHKEGGNIYPKINGRPFKFFGFNEVLERYKRLHDFAQGDVPPPRDFDFEYSREKIEKYYRQGRISKKKYGEWERKGIPPGDWQCSYCSFKHICKSDNR